MLGAVGVVGGQFGEGRFAAPQSAIKVRQSDRLGLVALHGAARASGKGGVQNGFSPFGQPCQPLHVHQVLLRAFGFDVVTDLCEKLLAAGAPGLHFYSMNMAGPTTEICRRLGITT